MARTLLFTDIHPTSLSPIVVQHPFTSSGFNMVMINGEPKCVDITEDSEALHQWRKMVCEQITMPSAEVRKEWMLPIRFALIGMRS